MSKMKKFKFLWLILLVLTLSACRVFGPKTFNAAGSEGSDFSFEYPLGWEVLYDSKSTWVFQDIGTIRVDENDDFTGFAATTVGIGFQSLDSEILQGKTPLEFLTEREVLMNEAWTEFEARDEADKVVTDINELESATSVPKVYQSPTAVQICDKELYILKFQWYQTFMDVLPTEKRYDAFTVLDGELVQITGLVGWIEEEEFESAFEAVVCSLEILDSE